MGMYNYLTFEEPPDLPGVDEYPEDVTWQTKAVGPNKMETLRVTADERLEREEVEYHRVPKEERPFPDAEEGSLREIFGSVGRERLGWTDLDYHGTVAFTGTVGDQQYHFEAKFTDGTLVETREEDR